MEYMEFLPMMNIDYRYKTDDYDHTDLKSDDRIIGFGTFGNFPRYGYGRRHGRYPYPRFWYPRPYRSPYFYPFYPYPYPYRYPYPWYGPWYY